MKSLHMLAMTMKGRFHLEREYAKVVAHPARGDHKGSIRAKLTQGLRRIGK